MNQPNIQDNASAQNIVRRTWLCLASDTTSPYRAVCPRSKKAVMHRVLGAEDDTRTERHGW